MILFRLLVHCLYYTLVSINKTTTGQKPGLVDSELDSESKGRAFESYTRWKWCQSHARLIKVYTILVHSIIEENKFENTGSQMGAHQKI